jgi:hypothetical protein
MCTRANRASVSDSAHALVGSFAALSFAIAALIAAIVTAPLRAVHTRTTRYGQPASTRDIEVQVHLADRDRVKTIQRSCRAALKRAARTWAPHRLPVDRVEIYPSAPPLGQADIFAKWLPAEGESWMSALVVVSIGTATDGRDLTPDEIAGVLTGQIERLVVEQYQREHPKEAAAVLDAAATSASIVGTARVDIDRSDASLYPDNLTDIRSVREHMQELRKGLPLVPAGPSQNGVHPEPSPAS